MVVSSPTGGVKPMEIRGRMSRERERCIGMTEEERSWRARFLKDQILTEREPVQVKELNFRNPIRSFYATPLDKLVLHPLTPKLGLENATICRKLVGKGLSMLLGVYCLVYYMRYNHRDWTKQSGWRIISTRPRCIPGDPGWPKVSEKTKFTDYADDGFSKAPRL